MVETRVFEELNVFNFDDVEAPGRPPRDLDLEFVPEPEPMGCLPYLFSKLKTKSSSSCTTPTTQTTTTTATTAAAAVAERTTHSQEASNPER